MKIHLNTIATELATEARSEWELRWWECVLEGEGVLNEWGQAFLSLWNADNGVTAKFAAEEQATIYASCHGLPLPMVTVGNPFAYPDLTTWE